jgi:hypothetical protein
MIGNPETFQKSKKGGPMWKKLFDSLRRDKHVYPGLPVKCERHPDRMATIATPEEFDRLSPDGGCTEDWRVFI